MQQKTTNNLRYSSDAQDMKEVIILNYHVLKSNHTGRISRMESLYCVALKDFEMQMELISALGIPVISTAHLEDPERLPHRSVAITFDDGNSTDLSDARPILKHYQYPATFFISMHSIDAGRITEENIRQLSNDGFGIGSHGMTHRDLTKISHDEQFNELHLSKIAISQICGKEITDFSLPFGMYNNDTQGLIKKAGYIKVYSSEFGPNNASSQPLIWKRWSIRPDTYINDFKKVISFDTSHLKRNIAIDKLKKKALYYMGTSLANRVQTALFTSPKR